MTQYLYINGSFTKSSNAAVSPYSRGLLYGDGIFETMRGYSGKVFALEEHFARLKTSAKFLDIEVPFGMPKLDEILRELLHLNALAKKDSRIRLNLIRGAGSGGLFPDETAEPEVFVTAVDVPENIGKIQREGVRLAIINNITLDNRSPFSRHKILNYLPGVLGLAEARKKGGDEGIFINYDGYVSEGTTSNLFAVKDGVVMTPPREAGILPGVTRSIVISLAQRQKLEVAEKNMTPGDFFEAEEIFITSSVREIVPVISANGRCYPIGPITKRLQEEYKCYVKKALKQVIS